MATNVNIQQTPRRVVTNRENLWGNIENVVLNDTTTPEELTTLTSVIHRAEEEIQRAIGWPPAGPITATPIIYPTDTGGAGAGYGGGTFTINSDEVRWHTTEAHHTFAPNRQGINISSADTIRGGIESAVDKINELEIRLAEAEEKINELQTLVEAFLKDKYENQSTTGKSVV